MVLYLFVTGVAIAVVTSIIQEKAFLSPSAQALPLAKYVCTIIYTSSERRWAKGRSRKQLTRRGRILLLTIGALGVVSYCLYCVGFALCGTGLALGLHAALGQTATAVFSVVLLKRVLTSRQKLSVLIVNVGLLVRAFAPSPAKSQGLKLDSSLYHGVSASTALGSIAILGSSLGYALLGVVYDMLIRTEKPAPSHTQIMESEGWLGLSAILLWQIFFTIPQWDAWVAAPTRDSGTSASAAISLLVLSGLIFILHYYNMGRVFARQGPVVVGLVNALRGAVVQLLAGAVFCTPERPGKCNTRYTVLSAAIVTVGAIVWVTGSAPTTSKRTAVSDQEPGADIASDKKGD